MRAFVSVFCFLMLVAGSVRAEVVLEPVEYQDGETVLQGFIAYDDAAAEKRPGVLVVHEWTGVGDYVKERARMLAELGYVAFVGDIYGKDVTIENTSEAAEWSSKFKNDRELFRQRVNLGLDQLKRSERVDASKTAAIGYCFGGTAVLELARSGAKVGGVVSFHGGLGSPTPEDAKNIRGRVLVCHGADDPHVPQKELLDFEEEMRGGDVDYVVIKYGDAVHSFTNPARKGPKSTGAMYNEKADKRSWEHMKQFLNEVFGE